MRLGGAARELVRSITPDEILNGGFVNGVQVDPITYIVAGLQQRFAMLDDEHRLVAMTQLLAFSRRQGESINGTLARYEVVRQRAAREGHFVMSWEGCALQILRACNVSSQQMIQFLQPFQGRLPQDEAEFALLSSHMRRIGRILEHSPNNLGQLLHGNRQATSGEYYADTALGYLQTTGEPITGNSFLWSDAPAASSWDHWQPDITAGGGDGWGDAVDQMAFPGFRQDDGESSDGTSSATSSDSGTEHIDMSDLQPMTDQQASEHVFWQYRMHRRRWRRLTGKPVRRFRRHVRHFCQAKRKRKRTKSGRIRIRRIPTSILCRHSG